MYPLLVRHFLYPLHERLKRKPTFRWLSELERTQWLDIDRLREYQFGRLREHLEFAYRHVPYYRALLDEHDLAPQRVKSPADVELIPFLTRDLLRSRFEDLRSTVKLPNIKRRSTGGSTGEPVTVEVDMERMGSSEAARLRAHRWFGIQPGAREIVLWGSPIELGRQDRARGLRDRLLNSRLLSAFDMGERALARQAATIARFGPEKMYGYASSLFLLARYFRSQGLPAPRRLKAVFTTAEPLFDFQRHLIEETFGCRVGVEYGSRDGGLVALECPQGGLHIFSEGMYVEIADPDADGKGEIVVTCFDSFCFPIVRYRTGDIGRLDIAPCPCGRALPKLTQVEGRRTDFLVSPSGRVLHALSAIYVLRDQPAVREFHLVQETIDRFALQIVTDRPLTRTEEARIREQFKRLMNADVSVDLQDVPTITRTSSGKFRYVESRISEDQLATMMRERA
jgi:phenylacetate-CoA ligase